MITTGPGRGVRRAAARRHHGGGPTWKDVTDAWQAGLTANPAVSAARAEYDRGFTDAITQAQGAAVAEPNPWAGDLDEEARLDRLAAGLDAE